MDMSYSKPVTVEDAVALLTAPREEIAILAGGTDLLPGLRTGERRFRHIVDIKGIPELARLEWQADGSLFIGATNSIARLAAHPDIQARLTCLAQGANAVGSPQIRWRATVGGNLCNASPCMDTAPPLLVLGACLVLAGPQGRRQIPLTDFFLNPGVTCLRSGELAIGLIVPPPPTGLLSGFLKRKRTRGHDLALVNVAGSWDPAEGRLKLAIGSCAARPVLLSELAFSQDVSAEDICTQASRLACDSISPIDDVRASAEYRLDMTATLTQRLVGHLLRSQPRPRGCQEGA